jgi:hypothetical protein
MPWQFLWASGRPKAGFRALKAHSEEAFDNVWQGEFRLKRNFRNFRFPRGLDRNQRGKWEAQQASTVKSPEF